MENTIYIVDDHKMLQNGLCFWFEQNSNWKITGTFASVKPCLEALAKTSSEDLPEIIIVDIQLADESGFSLVQEITKNYKQIKCIMYSMYDTAGYILQAKNSGASGYISKVASEKEILKCLDIVKNGGTYLESRFESIMENLEPITSVLSNQESIVFEKMLQGKSNEEISSELFISLHSVHNYVTYIYTLSDVHNRTEFLEKFGKK
ncbi:MAG: response regulator transcription factor [Treponema sp.]|nr:response regulator transcription factor [Treponema sp.]